VIRLPKTVALTVPVHDARRRRAALAVAKELSDVKEINVVVQTHRPLVDARAVYGSTDRDLPATDKPDVEVALGAEPVHSGPIRAFTAFYRDPVAWVALLVTSVLLCYGGGAAMFYIHAIYFNEGGPAISPYLHWALDSTFGFIALTPIVAILLPISTLLVRRLPKWSFALVFGVLFAIITVPGPLAHDMFVARGTPIAMVVTHYMGDPTIVVPPPTEYSTAAKMAHQFVGGLPVYLVLSTVAFWIVRLVVRPKV
jgi:hypothetical protein